MFIPVRKDGLLFKRAGQNAYNEPVYRAKGLKFGWGPIYMRQALERTEVRADKSASKSRAETDTIDYRMVIEKTVTPERGDLITLSTGERMKVILVHRRVDIMGRLHHWEVDCVAE
ncbi:MULTISPECIES: hypothetical protein [Aeromonas]|uniref:Head-tail adaptor protein n=1 Tax=Aeromonas veronii TaxID=654 RepID=A0AAX2UP07_AERVE|nr:MULTISPECIES: hypothetical protein [Aeromonas]MCD6618760.1 hypothetical protein [Aeromonas veronii]QWZ66379.1 hypothetical protein I6L47_22275 [Aeromonas sp. FDAARGOS 1417]TND51892.1 hypothetical protein CF123_18660 [Aeromonas veronii]BEE07088.1 hypothetical protein VAWG002_42840 [Aeromonas veronii]